MIRDHSEFQAQIDDYVDGLLPDARRRAMELHLERCEPCRSEAEGIVALQARARDLPRTIAPGRDLWPEIAARLSTREAGPDVVPAVDVDRTPGPSREVIPLPLRRFPHLAASRTWVLQAAAAVLLVVLSSSATVYWMGRTGGAGLPAGASPTVATGDVAPVEGRTPARLVGGVSAGPAAATAAFAAAEGEYRSTVEALRQEFEQRKPQLLPETVATVERSLQLIDQAILEAMAALEADPGNPELPLMLSGIYRQKVELLQRAAQL